MKKYEYKLVSVEDISRTDILEIMLKKLNEEGAKGWKLVAGSFSRKEGQMLLERKKE